MEPPKTQSDWAPVHPGCLQLSSSGGHGALPRPKACRACMACMALHALARRKPGELLNSVLHPPRDPHRTLPKTRWGSFQAFVPPTRRKWSSMASRPGAPNSNTHHVGGVGREGRRPARSCACVAGRPAPSSNELPTWAPIGWGHTCIRTRMLTGKTGRECVGSFLPFSKG